MTISAADVAEIMRLVEQSTFDEMTLEVDGLKLSFRRGAGTDTAPAQPAPAAIPKPAEQHAHKPATPAKAVSIDPSAQEVTSPLLGTFYRAPKPGAPPFVEAGSQVEEDTVVAIIEVMKLMNTVRAGVKGRVTEILVADGALVEYGETLLRVSKAG